MSAPADAPSHPSAREWAIVMVAWAVLSAVAVVWLSLDHRPPEWDYANHLERAVRCVRYLAAGDLGAVLAQSSFYPPLAICAGGLAYALAPSDRLSPQTAVLAFLALGMAAVLVLGRMLVGPRAGVVAALLFASAPFVVFSSVHFQVDLPLAAMVAVALAVLVKSRRLQHAGWSATLGIVLALGMLTKPSFAVYLAPPLAWAVISARSRRALRHAGLALAIGAVVCLPWYGPRLFGMGHQTVARSFAQAAEEGDPPVMTWAALTFYPAWLPTQFGVAATAAFLAGLVMAVRARHWLLLVALLVPFTGLLGLQNKDLRYTLPLLPVVAVVAALGLEGLLGRVRTVVLGVLVLVGLAQVSGTAFGVPRGDRLPLLGSPGVLAQPPQREPWPHRALLRAVEADSGGRPVTVSIVPNHPQFSVSNFRYYAVRDGLALQTRRSWDGHPVGIDYMVLKTGDLGPSWTVRRPTRVTERLARDAHLARVYPVLVETPLPDGSTATVRVRRVHAADEVSGALVARGLENGLRAGLDGFARDLHDLTVRVVHDERIRQGRVERIEIAGASVVVADYGRRDPPRLRVRDFAATLEDVLVNPHSAVVGRLQLLEVGRVRLDAATVDIADLEAVLRAARRAPGASILAEAGALRVRLPGPGLDVSARVRVLPSADAPLALAFEDVRVAGLRIPDAVVRWVAARLDPTARLQDRWGVETRIAAVTIADGVIRIGTGARGGAR